jgi:GT2 family glycosyltransferase
MEGKIAMAPVTSILILRYKNDLQPCLDSIRENTDLPYELKIGDNSPPFENVGFAKGMNRLIRESTGEYLILLNPDTLVTKNWLTELVNLARSDGRIGIIQPKMLLYNGRLDSTGHEWRTKYALTGFPYRAVIDRGSGEEDKGQYDKNTELNSCCFGAALIRRDVFSQIGLLDERFFLLFEDVDFCLRARDIGWRVIYCPTSVVYHKRHGSGKPTMNASWSRFVWKRYGPLPYARVKAMNFLGIMDGVRHRDLEYIYNNFWLLILP